MEQMSKTLADLKSKINKYCKKYSNSRTVYLKMIWYCIGKIFSAQESTPSVNKSETLNISISISGGIGDILYRAVWIKEFSKLLNDNCKIDLYILNKSKTELTKSIFYKNKYISNIIYSNHLPKDNYDLALTLNWFAKIEHLNKEKIINYSQNLYSFLTKYREFEEKFIDFFQGEIESYYDRLMLYAINNGKKLSQIPDIDNLLGISSETGSNLCINTDYFGVLNDFSLENTNYITFVYDVDSTSDLNHNVRLWPLDYFKTLICKIKENYPNIKTVQIGTRRSPLIPEIDIDLRGKTNFEQAKIVLKNSILHIDGECGMVHLKHYLNGQSAVLFGQTSIKVKGYNNNINLKSDGCPHWCEWIVNDWQTRCIRGFAEPPCMTELKPDYVFEKIKPLLEEKLNQPQKVVDEMSVTDLNEYFANNYFENSKIVFFGKEFFDVAKKLSKNNSVEIYDYDLDWQLFDKAKKENIKIDYADIYNLPQNDESCDIIVTKELSNFDNSEFAKRELSRILKNGKTLLLNVGESNARQ